MGLVFYTLARLREIAKAQRRSHAIVASANSATGSDGAIIIETASILFQAAQVAAQYIYEQIFPKTADATNRERMLAENGVDFTKPATKARGYIVVSSLPDNIYDHQVKKGTTFEFPSTAFPDGIARSYVALEDATFRSVGDHWATETAANGCSLTKIRTRTKSMRRGDCFSRVAGSPARIAFSVVRNVDIASRHVDLFVPLSISVGNGDSLIEDTWRLLVKAESADAGEEGNGSSFVIPVTNEDFSPITSSDEVITAGYVLEMSGGGDEVGEIDPDEERVIRVLEDTIAGAPSNGNPQHWREIALACPDVALDDAIVYMGVRGPGTVDIVAIGKSGQLRPTGLDTVNVEHLAFGHNSRRIGEVQAAIVERWCNFNADGTPRTHYYDDVKVHSVEWDWRGRSNNHYSTDDFLRSSNAFVLSVQAQSGYGPDSGSLDVMFPYKMDADEPFSRLYASSSTARVPANLKVGDRVAVTVDSTGNTVYPFATVITEVIGFDYDRRYAVIKDLSSVARLVCQRAEDSTFLRWWTAGPLDQQIDDAVHAYFDSLGPGSYTVQPFDPGVQNYYAGLSVAARPFPGTQLERWPDEGRRWSGALRKSALLSRLHAIEGIKSVTILSYDGAELVDMDAAPLMTLRLAGSFQLVSP
jgi:uncharacterized phage protein gp47/JayE